MRVQQINVARERGSPSRQSAALQPRRQHAPRRADLAADLVDAQQQLIQARLNYRNARAQIEAAIGRDLP